MILEAKRELTMILEAKCELKRIAKETGFAVRGNACFRVIGDGVLQVLKFECSRGIWHLDVGLQSMYSELLPQWFTSFGCIPQFQAVKFAGIRDVMIVSERGGLTYFDPVPPAEQLKILVEKGLPVMDQILTQDELVRQRCKLNMVRMQTILWNDMEKFAPFLKSGDFESAERVLEALLALHDVTNESNRSENDFRQKEVEKLNKLLDMVRAGDRSVIDAYLDENYKKNCGYAKFCMKK